MQTIHSLCCFITFVGFVIGMGHSGKIDSNDTIIEYEAFDEGYVDYDKGYNESSEALSVPSVAFGIWRDPGVIESKHREQEIRDGFINPM